jgi:hypothetical protein
MTYFVVLRQPVGYSGFLWQGEATLREQQLKESWRSESIILNLTSKYVYILREHFKVRRRLLLIGLTSMAWRGTSKKKN